jgi:hypothetical protein
MDSVSQSDSVNLQLGDIIQLISPSDDATNMKQYLISYIDKTRIELRGIDSLLTISINTDGSLSNESITGISILSRASEIGYARQNKLVPGQWIDLHFSGDLPTIMTGEITNLEEDQIEVKLVEGEIIYIDFEYKGIPEDIPIDRFILREQPEGLKNVEISQPVDNIDNDTNKEEENDDNFDIQEQASPIFKDRVKEILFDADQIQFGDELGVVRHMVQVPDEEKRYGIEKQTTDLLNELLSDIPNSQRTYAVLNNIHMMIERFKQLRKEFSNFDEKGNADKPNIQGANFKPLVERLERLNQRLYWILPVVKSRKKLYDVDESAAEMLDDVEPETLAAIRTAEAEVLSAFKRGTRGYDYMVKQLSEYWTPFTQPENPSQSLTTQHVETNISSIVDTLGDFYTSVASNEDIKRKRFLIQRYNLGENTLTSHRIKGGGTVVNVKEITKPDKITIGSFLTLPKPAVQYSQVDLPATNIMRRCDISRYSISYWKMLNSLTNVKTRNVDSEEPLVFDKTEYLQTPTNFTINDNTNITYRQYLNSIIPKTRILFDIVKNDIHGKLSIQSVLDSLQPFLIYQRDLSFMQYVEITDFIIDKITEFKRSYIVSKRAYDALIGQSQINRRNNGPAFLSIIRHPDAANKIVDAYDLERYPLYKYSNAEFLSLINSIDYGRFFNDIIAEMSESLMVANGMEQLNNVDDIDISKISPSKNDKQADCAQYVLSNRYMEIDELEDDNGKQIFFDKMYDKTYYDIIDEYKNDISDIQDKQQQIDIIANKIQENTGMNEKDSKLEAEAMIIGMRPVKDGNYAVVVIEDTEEKKFLYFKRRDNTWVRDETISSGGNDVSSLFCNLKEGCISFDNTCNSIPKAAIDIQSQVYAEMLNEFTENLQQNAKAISSMLENEMNNTGSRLGPLIDLNDASTIKYDVMKYNLGKDAKDVFVEKSPMQKLLDMILIQGDFVKRQTDISKFVAYYTRPSGKDESKWWLYCPISNAKLLPTFVAKLADAFVKKDDYFLTLQRIVAEQGDESGDGESIVDRHTQWIITSIDFSADEGFTAEGFVMKTRDILEADLGNVLAQAPGEELDEYESKEAQIVFRIIKAMSKFMGIDISSIQDFVIGETTKLLAKTMSSKQDYDAAISAAAAGGSKKKFDPYEKVYDRTLLLYTIGFLLVGIQTSIPPIRTRKTYPGCVRSFTGYPCAATADKTAIEYIICVAKGISSGSVRPWSTISKMSASKITTTLTQFIDKFIIKTESTRARIRDKDIYDSSHSPDKIPEDVSIKNWINFLPPLRQVKIGTVSPPAAEWQSVFTEAIKSGRKTQDDMILAMKSKIIYLALSVEEEVEKVVKKNIAKETAILSNSAGEPFLENACCNDGNENTYDYFVKNSKLIERNNSVVSDLRAALDDINSLEKAPVLFDDSDTRIKYPPLPNEFDEETIYRAFITYCKYDSDVPVSEELRALCMGKPEDIQNLNSIEDKIKTLKREGKNFDNNSLTKLMSIVNQQNLVNIDYKGAIFSNIQKIRERLRSMDERNNNILPVVFREKMMSALEKYGINYDKSNDSDEPITKDTSEVRSFKNYLASANNQMIVRMNDFVNRNSGGDAASKKQFSNCLNNIPSFNGITDDDPLTTFRSSEFMKNALHCLVRVFPNIIINKVSYTKTKIPAHWKLSQIHNDDIQSFISEHYAPLSKFYGDEMIANAMSLFQHEQLDTMLLSLDTMFLAPITRSGSRADTVFDMTMIDLLFRFYFLSLLVEMSKLSEREELYTNEPNRVGATLVNPILQSVDVALLGGEEPVFEMIAGQKKKFVERIASACSAFVSILCRDKRAIDYNYNTLSEKITRAKEKEKDVIIDYLTNITDEQRDVEKRFKQHKLGERWNIGQQKGFRIYEGNTYDAERKEIEKRAVIERQLGVVDGVTDDLMDIFVHDRQQADQTESDINDEEYAIALGEDNDDYGDPDDNDGY